MSLVDVTAKGTPKTPANVVPDIIADRYKVEREIGRGGMATVYLCTDSHSGESVAVKLLRPELGSAVVMERFLREIAFASELDHPQIPKVLGSGILDGVPFYVMTYSIARSSCRSMKLSISRSKSRSRPHTRIRVESFIATSSRRTSLSRGIPFTFSTLAWRAP
jgi:serine/threonine protein kinase